MVGKSIAIFFFGSGKRIVNIFGQQHPYFLWFMKEPFNFFWVMKEHCNLINWATERLPQELPIFNSKGPFPVSWISNGLDLSNYNSSFNYNYTEVQVQVCQSRLRIEKDDWSSRFMCRAVFWALSFACYLFWLKKKRMMGQGMLLHRSILYRG